MSKTLTINTGTCGAEQEAHHANGCLAVTSAGFAVTVAVDVSSHPDVDAAQTEQEVAELLRKHLGPLPFTVGVHVGPNVADNDL